MHLAEPFETAAGRRAGQECRHQRTAARAVDEMVVVGPNLAAPTAIH
jgi:hypothetical protein